MKKGLSEGFIIVIIGLGLIFFEAIVKFLGAVIVVYGLIELFGERKERREEEPAQTSYPKETPTQDKPSQEHQS